MLAISLAIVHILQCFFKKCAAYNIKIIMIVSRSYTMLALTGLTWVSTLPRLGRFVKKKSPKRLRRFVKIFLTNEKEIWLSTTVNNCLVLPASLPFGWWLKQKFYIRCTSCYNLIFADLV